MKQIKLRKVMLAGFMSVSLLLGTASFIAAEETPPDEAPAVETQAAEAGPGSGTSSGCIAAGSGTGTSSGPGTCPCSGRTRTGGS